MGTRGDNGGNERPQEGGGLPDLPPEWGIVIIPDDASALDDEGFDHSPKLPPGGVPAPLAAAAAPQAASQCAGSTTTRPASPFLCLIMTVAVIATLTSLFAVAWPGQRPRTVPPPVRSPQTISIADIALVNDKGMRVLLRDVAPGRDPAGRELPAATRSSGPRSTR